MADTIGKVSGGKERFIEKLEPRNTNYNETVRANNKRMDRGEPTKDFPRGAAASRIYKKRSRSSVR